MPTDFIFLFMIGVDFFMIRVDPSPILFYLYFFIRFEWIRVDTCLKMFVCPVPKISHVKMKWCRRASYLGRFTLWNNSRRRASHLDRFTLWNNGRRATQLGRFTLWHYGRLATQLSFNLWHNRRWASQLAGKFTLWHNGRRAKQPGLMHARRSSTHFPKKKYEGLIQSKILLRV